MSREIKFRAWDGNKVVDFGDLMCKQGHFNAFINTLAERTAANKPNDNKYKLMQYTGLKDKNGVEIYEGDIIRLYDGATHHIYEVLYSEPDTAFTLKAHGRWWGTDISTKLYLSEWENLDIRYKMSYYSLSAIEEDYEVIGNIYENQELLEAEL